MKTSIHMWSHVAEFFLERHMFQIKLVEKLKIHISYSIFFRKSRRLWDEVQKYCTAEQATDDAHAHYVLDN